MTVHPTEVNEGLYENTLQKANYDKSFVMFENQANFITACSAFHEAMVLKGEAYDSSRWWCWARDFARWTTVQSEFPTLSFPVADEALFNEAVEAWIQSTAPYSYGNRSDAIYEDRTGEDLK